MKTWSYFFNCVFSEIEKLGVIFSTFGETDIRLFCEMDLSQPKEIVEGSTQRADRKS